MIKYYEQFDKKWFIDRSKLCYEKDSIVYEAENSVELNLHNPQDICIGVIGDGCGGGRVFIADTDNNMIKAYEPESGDIIILADNISKPKLIKKIGCMLYITNDINETIEIDLQLVKHQ